MVLGEAEEIGPRPVIKNSFAFGGHNTSVAIVPPGWPSSTGATGQ
jgi:hypothetical protein